MPRALPLKISLPENETAVNLKSASSIIIMLLHKGFTYIQSQINPRLLFGASFILRNVPSFFFFFGNDYGNICDEVDTTPVSPVRCATGLEGRTQPLGLSLGEGSSWPVWGAHVTSLMWVKSLKVFRVKRGYDIPAMSLETDAEVSCSGNEIVRLADVCGHFVVIVRMHMWRRKYHVQYATNWNKN